MSSSATVMTHLIKSQRSCRVFFLYRRHADYFWQTVGYRDVCGHGLYPRRPMHCCGYVQHIRKHTQTYTSLPMFLMWSLLKEKKSTRSPSASYKASEIYFADTNQNSFVRKILLLSVPNVCSDTKQGDRRMNKHNSLCSLAFYTKNAQTPECMFKKWLHGWNRRTAFWPNVKF